MAKPDILEFVKTMKPRDHVILFYSDHKDRDLVLFTYLKAGLDSGEAALYVTCERTPQEVLSAMREFSIDVERYQRTAALRVVDYRDWYVINGEFDIGRTMALWKKALEETQSRGFEGLRVTGEMSCLISHGMVNQLILYERALHQTLEMPLAAICAYDDAIVLKGAEEQRYLKLYLDLIAAHSTILFLGPEEAGVLKVV